MQHNGENGGECFAQLFSSDKERVCALDKFFYALDFVRQTDEFGVADLQKYLKCGFGTLCKITDALSALDIVEPTGGFPRRYKRVASESELTHDIYYNGSVYEDGSENDSGWDPSLFRSREACIDYVKKAYGDIKKPVYMIDKIRIGEGFDVIAREEIKGYGEDS